ncbi:Uncharacterised protein [Algoriella xinjiangensis]|uniref:helix-turn-helix domain-containing protein n=1 Tax=Algoriella xinjiangensis TaxID=684065 RepID=UPI000F62E6F9|nr:helix-turn-helix domain-containing protein [Algoriella xinjiangensis]VDH16762.1 Uncharacterised protein [Algoriella xinjiangensis]
MSSKKEFEKEKAKNLLETTILSQKEIAIHLGVTEKTVSKWKIQFEKEKTKKEFAVEYQLSKVREELEEIKTILKSKLWR